MNTLELKKYKDPKIAIIFKVKRRSTTIESIV